MQESAFGFKIFKEREEMLIYYVFKGKVIYTAPLMSVPKIGESAHFNTGTYRIDRITDESNNWGDVWVYLER